MSLKVDFNSHNSAAIAIADELKRRGHNVTFLDPYKLSSDKTEAYVGGSYTKLVQKSPLAFGFVYLLGSMYRKLPIHSPVYWVNKRMVNTMEQYLSEHEYDFIIMSHLYPSLILTNMKKSNIEIPKTMLVATDYTCIPFT